MALARILTLARIARGLASAVALAGVDPHTLDGCRLLGGSRGGGQATHGKSDRCNGEGRAGHDICLHANNLLMNSLAERAHREPRTELTNRYSLQRTTKLQKFSERRPQRRRGGRRPAEASRASMLRRGQRALQRAFIVNRRSRSCVVIHLIRRENSNRPERAEVDELSGHCHGTSGLPALCG